MASIFYFLFWAGLFVVMMRFGCGAHVMGHGHQRGNAPSDAPKSDSAGNRVPPAKDVDPVCHMSVDTATAKTAVYGGHVYHFCSPDCRTKFESNPPSYLTTANNASIANEHPHAS